MIPYKLVKRLVIYHCYGLSSISMAKVVYDVDDNKIKITGEIPWDKPLVAKTNLVIRNDDHSDVVKNKIKRTALMITRAKEGLLRRIYGYMTGFLMSDLTLEYQFRFKGKAGWRNVSVLIPCYDKTTWGVAVIDAKAFQHVCDICVNADIKTTLKNAEQIAVTLLRNELRKNKEFRKRR